MKTFALALVMLLVIGAQVRAEDEVEKIQIEFKSGEKTPEGGVLKDVSETGVTIVGADGVPFFIRWSLVRGDKHFDLRKRACDYKSLASIISLADFCHDFALDRKEAEALVEALKLSPA